MSQMNSAEKGEVVRVMAEKMAEQVDEAKTLRGQEKNVESERMENDSLKTPMRKNGAEKEKSTQQISTEEEKLKTEKEKFEREKIELHKIAERIEAERKRLDLTEKKSKNENKNKQNRDEFETEKKESNEDKESEKKRLRSEEDSERKRTKLEQIRVESEKRKLELEKVEKERLLREESDDAAKNVEEDTEKDIKRRKTEPNKTTNEKELLRKEAKVTLNRICPEPNLGKHSLKKDFQQTTSKKFIKCKLCTKIVITKSYQEHLAKSHDITDNYEDLDLHSTVEKESPPKCEKCGEQLGDGALLKTHMCKQSPAKQKSLKLMCDKCKKKFREERYLRMHLRMNTMCKTDEKSSNSLEDANNETESEKFNAESGKKAESQKILEKRPIKPKCAKCEKTFAYKRQLRKHMKICTSRVSAKNVKCKLCDLVLRKMNLSRHLRNQHDNYERAKYDAIPVPNAKMGEESKKIRNTINNEKNSNGVKSDSASKSQEIKAHSATNQVQCKLCSKYFFRIKRHVRESHKDLSFDQYLSIKDADHQKDGSKIANEKKQEDLPKPTKGSKSWCKMCSQDLKPDSYRAHMVRHLNEAIAAKEVVLNEAKSTKDDKPAGVSEKPLITEPSSNLCNNDFLTVKMEKIESIMDVSAEEHIQQEKCKLCYSLFDNKSKLEEHVKLVHMDDMEALMKDFTEEDCIFQCPKCSEKFFTANIRLHHVVEKHSKGKEALVIGPTCAECDKTFSSNQALKRHKNTQHTDLLKPALSLKTPEKTTMEMVKLNFQELLKKARTTEKKRDFNSEVGKLSKEKTEGLHDKFESGRIEGRQEVVEMVEKEEEEVVEIPFLEEVALSLAEDDDCIPTLDPTLLERVKGL